MDKNEKEKLPTGGIININNFILHHNNPKTEYVYTHEQFKELLEMIKKYKISKLQINIEDILEKNESKINTTEEELDNIIKNK